MAERLKLKGLNHRFLCYVLYVCFPPLLSIAVSGPLEVIWQYILITFFFYHLSAEDGGGGIVGRSMGEKERGGGRKARGRGGGEYLSSEGEENNLISFSQRWRFVCS